MSDNRLLPGFFLRLNFAIALFSTLGSLYFSEIMKFPPCSLCWYQRASVYPLVVLFGVALLTADHAHTKYSLPLILTGLALAIYHNLLYYGIIATSIVPCTADVSCSSRQLEMFGFVTIPLLSLGALLAMASMSLLELIFVRRLNGAKR